MAEAVVPCRSGCLLILGGGMLGRHAWLLGRWVVETGTEKAGCAPNWMTPGMALTAVTVALCLVVMLRYGG